MAGSEGGRSGSGGVLGTSMLSMAGGGGRPGISVPGGIDVAGTDGCTGSSWLGAARGAFGAGGGAGLLNILAQLRVPSGFELGFGSSGGAWAASGVIFSQDDSRGVLSALVESQPPVEASVGIVLSNPTASVATASSFLVAYESRELFTKPPLPPLAAPRPRSVPRPRVPRAMSLPPRPRPPRVDCPTASVLVAGGSFALDWDRSLTFFLTSPHCELLPGFHSQHGYANMNDRFRET